MNPNERDARKKRVCRWEQIAGALSGLAWELLGPQLTNGMQGKSIKKCRHCQENKQLRAAQLSDKEASERLSSRTSDGVREKSVILQCELAQRLEKRV
jgi:hypothetical protein